MARATVRWASTWSEPFWASSSTTKIAMCFQNRLLDSPSTSASQREVVVADAGRHGPFAGRCSRRVVVGQAQNDQAGHLAGLLKLGQFLQEAIGALDVGIVHVEAAETWDRSAPREP